MNHSKKLLIIVGSPRRTGNSATLAAAVQRGAEAAEMQVSLRFIDDSITSFLRDCRQCRLPNGECAIEDNFRALFFDDFLPADGVVFCSPVYWYGLSAQTKVFFDRTFCYYAASYPDSAQVMHQMTHKRIGLVLASEETYPGASLGIVHQIQEYCRYTHSEFVGVVHGVGNSRSEVLRDPSAPIVAAEQLGREIFNRKYSDFRIDTERSGRVWPQDDGQS
ncbi:flavodoxin family protein [Leptothoe sp. PORK10 BA2]|uniref:flavodoxin family protein n=1 Tax=Leptothoe sp. PORK10 BA2 TaxID=3110254 RepID=UPI002B204C4A|nr:flavodoxin family protein [Leptothoe sp. PORK10 BA2]MEA5463758.1 flavodoxin family protein [Leptothoe sp. PORK10 BA2]